MNQHLESLLNQADSSEPLNFEAFELIYKNRAGLSKSEKPLALVNLLESYVTKGSPHVLELINKLKTLLTVEQGYNNFEINNIVNAISDMKNRFLDNTSEGFNPVDLNPSVITYLEDLLRTAVTLRSLKK